MKKEKKYYKIGEISKLYKISSDILRHYERIGLISPDFRDENGYRYYSKKQIWKLNNIRNLRNLGVGLVEIKEFLEERNIETTKYVIEFQLKKIEKTMEELLQLKEELEVKKNNILYYEDYKNFNKPIIKNISSRKFIKKNGDFKYDWEIDYELRILNEKIEFESDFIFTENQIGATLKKEEFINSNYNTYYESFIINECKGEIVPEGMYLTLVFKGSYKNTTKYYENLKKYMELNNYEVIGDIFEIYHVDIHITENEEEFITEIQIPIKIKRFS
ncbi:MerR family transcriptional regulator [Cetobacterium sp. SF1]|uniref:MerR family transcriptional regulator n=1 Tax=Cetobacterium sp. SF1 TaxID=3417654 RepID=UPI003CE78B94